MLTAPVLVQLIKTLWARIIALWTINFNLVFRYWNVEDEEDIKTVTTAATDDDDDCDDDRDLEEPRYQCFNCHCSIDATSSSYRCQAKECLERSGCINLCIKCYPRRDSFNHHHFPKPHKLCHTFACIDPTASERFYDSMNRLCFRKRDLDAMAPRGSGVHLVYTDRNFGDYISNSLDDGSIQIGVEYDTNDFFRRIGCCAIYFHGDLYGPGGGRIAWDFDKNFARASWETAKEFMLEGLVNDSSSQQHNTHVWYPFDEKSKMPIDNNKNYSEYPDTLMLGFRGCMVTENDIATSLHLRKVRVARVGDYAFEVFLC